MSAQNNLPGNIHLMNCRATGFEERQQVLGKCKRKLCLGEMLVTGRGEDGGNQSKSVKEGVSQVGEGSTRRKTGGGAGKEVPGESKVKAAGNQQQMDLKVKGAPGGSQQVEGGGSSPAGAGGSGGSDQLQENGNRWSWLTLSSIDILYLSAYSWVETIKIEMYIFLDAIASPSS